MKQEIVMISKEELFAQLREQLTEIVGQQKATTIPRYVTPQVAMEILNVKVSKLQSLRNNYEIKYSRTSSRGLMYNYQSLMDYLDRNQVL